MNEINIEKLLKYFQHQNDRLYAVFDAARDKQIIELLLSELGHVYFESLYDGSKSVRLASVAPYLVEIQAESHFFKKFLLNGWGDSWGILIKSKENFKNIREHLCLFLIIQKESKKELYFRFYDPRVLRMFLPTCTDIQLQQFFGLIDNFFVEGENKNLIDFCLHDQKLKIVEQQFLDNSK